MDTVTLRENPFLPFLLIITLPDYEGGRRDIKRTSHRYTTVQLSRGSFALNSFTSQFYAFAKLPSRLVFRTYTFLVTRFLRNRIIISSRRDGCARADLFSDFRC